MVIDTDAGAKSIMVAEIYGSIAAFKTMFDLAKGLKDINDAAVRNSAIVELTEKILSAREAQTTALERIRELEQQVANFETWETEKQRYEMKIVADGATTYALKPGAQPTEPPHWICAACYQNRRKSLMQVAGPTPHNSRLRSWRCPACPAGLQIPFGIVPKFEIEQGDSAPSSV